jgi:hypothetical protein
MMGEILEPVAAPGCKWAPFVRCRIVLPGPAPRRVTLWLSMMNLPSPIVNVPAESETTWPAGQALIAFWISAVSSLVPPSGLTVAHATVRFGMPPTESSPAFFQFAVASRSDGSRPPGGSELPLEASLSEHDAVLPPLLPAQFHDHGPLPLTADAVLPALQRFVVGAVLTVAPFALPHAPFTGDGGSTAEQLAVVPPPEPAQVQLHGPLPLTADAVPVLQRLAVGLLVRSAPFEEPQTPLTAEGDVETGVSVA